MANKNKLKPKGHLYISSPTLESLALLCDNAKKVFHRLEALQRLNAYKEGVLKGYMGESQTLFEEL